MKNLKLTIGSFIFLVHFTCFAQTKIDSSLIDEIKKSESPDSNFTAIVMLNNQEEIETLSNELEGQTRDVVHEQVVTALQNKANETQTALVDYLETNLANGMVAQYQRLWIINAIIVTAKKEVIYELDSRDEIAFIYRNYEITTTNPVEQEFINGGIATSIEPGLTLINADCLWNQGYTGLGRIVSNLDTGVDGSHPALMNKWRGNIGGVTVAESWFDPNGLSPSFPVDSGSHGTHTMGTMVGSEPGDIIGVAYDATWIAAGVIDIGGITGTIANALLAFQWSADPDGNPATVSDVPDVSSNSWGLAAPWHIPAPCDVTFWSAIDNLEAATVVVVFAAGNEGSGTSTLRSPADRATTFHNAFSVGALDTTGSTIASYSSRGPSLCTGPANQLIKPEVVARGSSVRSSVPGGYANFSGTSMATPHVAGAVALLRQVNPNATVLQIKDALMQSASDLGASGEDNDYGHGLIDVCLAATLILPCPSTLNLTANVTTTDQQEAQNKITASNTIFSGATGIYHAGDEVLLTANFTSVNGSIFRAYIEGCTGNFVARQIPDNEISYNYTDTKNHIVNEIIKIAPNPNNGIFKINLKDISEGIIDVTDLYGYKIYNYEFRDQTEFEMNMQEKPKGIYIVKVISGNETFTGKIIKN